jgi:hypothetical protein
MFMSKGWSLPSRTKPEKMFHLGRLLPYSKNIRLGWKGLTGANILAYYENS